MKQRVIIIGNSYSTRLGLIRAVSQLGCEILVIHIGDFSNHSNCSTPILPIDGYSRWVDKILYFNRKEGEAGLVRLLLDKCTVEGQKTIIIPTSDFSALAIDDEALKAQFLVPHISNKISSVGYWMDKSHQKELAVRVGLKTANSVIIEKNETGYTIPNDIHYPCFTKPVTSIGAGKKCLQRCNTSEDLQSVLKVAEKNNISRLLVEDYINIDQEYAVLGFSNGEDVMIPGIIEFQRECQSHKGIAMTGKVVPIDGFESIIELFTDFIRQLGFVGLFDIDFFESKENFYFDELNLRTGGSGTAIFSMGVNLPVMFIKTMLGEGIDNMPRFITRKATFLNERMAIADFKSGYMSTRGYKRLVNSTEIHFVKDESDPAPYEAIQKEFSKNILNCKRIVKRILHIRK